MRHLVKDCNCEDWPCCVHADNEAVPLAHMEPQDLHDLQADLIDCDGPDSTPDSICEQCPDFKDCRPEQYELSSTIS